MGNFRHFSPTDIKYLAEFLPDASGVPRLANYEFIHYSQGDDLPPAAAHSG